MPQNRPSDVTSKARRTVSLLEGLENRRLLANTFGSLSDGVLTVNGTAAADTLTASVRGDRFRVVLNGVMSQWAAADVAEIDAYMGEGNNTVDFRAIGIRAYAIGGTGNDLLMGGSGNDSLTGAAGKDTVVGGAGNDRLNGGKTADVVEGDAGDDVIYGGDGDDRISGGDGSDHVFAEAGNDVVSGDAGRDFIYGGDGADRIDGGADGDLLSGDADADKIYGGDGNDKLVGGGGRDFLYGDAGNDVIDAVDGANDRAVDGGAGRDTITQDASEAAIVTGGETVTDGTPTDGGGDGGGDGTPTPAPVGGGLVKGLSFADEALWEHNFAGTVAEVKRLGVTTVRVWTEVASYDERPHAWDAEDDRGIVHNWDADTSGDDRAVTAGLAIKRAIQLKAMGFKVVLTVSVHGGAPPASAQKVKDFYGFLESSTLNENGTGGDLKDAVDAWEVGQEVDLAKNWQPSGANKSAGLKSYVDQVLLPAASVLHSGNASTWEKVISASVTYSANDISTIMGEVKAQDALSAVDYIGYHPYGRYLPDQGIDEISGRVTQAAKVSKTYGKPLAATEWNVRGYPIDGSRDTQWAAAIASVYQNSIKPNFGIATYFTVIDNYAARGGSATATARPAGLFAHNSPVSVTTNSSVDDLLTYFDSPIVKNQPFYDTFAAF